MDQRPGQRVALALPRLGDPFPQQETCRFDQFTIEQIAGDMLPNATVDQRVATGFIRNSMLQTEGGHRPRRK